MVGAVLLDTAAVVRPARSGSTFPGAKAEAAARLARTRNLRKNMMMGTRKGAAGVDIRPKGRACFTTNLKLKRGKETLATGRRCVGTAVTIFAYIYRIANTLADTTVLGALHVSRACASGGGTVSS
eukprot:2862508-Rhodomonas_salina.2